MNLLIVTQKVDKGDDILGFFHAWIIAFAKRVERLTVICLYEGEHDLPGNVRVLSLGKERGSGKLSRSLKFLKYVWQERSNYSHVFVHMNPEYFVLGGVPWKLLGKKMSLWYTHRAVHWKLRVANFFADTIFTVAGDSLQLYTPKKKIVGHGIDASKFVCESRKERGAPYMISSIGRITKIKHPGLVVETAKILKDRGHDIKWQFVGSPGSKQDEELLAKIKEDIKERGLESDIVFRGSMPNKEILSVYCKSDLTVNPLPTGGVDKVVLESMAAMVPALSSNKAFEGIFGPYRDHLMFEFGSAESLAGKIEALLKDEPSDMRAYLRKEVEDNHNLERLVDKIISCVA